MKKWLSKALVLAMIVAMMIPVPVAAKSSSGGALIKSVEAYDYNTSTGGWDLNYTESYSYDKKGYPTESVYKWNYDTFMGIPVDATAEIYTYKYKFKGSTPKSMKIENTAGVPTNAYKYKKGKVVSGTYTYFDTDNMKELTSTGAFAYDKKGNLKASTSVDSNGGVSNRGYVVKKNLVAYNSVDSAGKQTQGYVAFNKDGLVTEAGLLNAAGQPVPRERVVYTKKKGKVVTVAVYSVDEKTGAQTPSRVYKFKYTKNKISKSRYNNMINDFATNYMPFFWY